MTGKPSKEFSTRYDMAKRWRDVVRPTIEEIYSFICPGREWDFDGDLLRNPRDNDAETFISLPEDLAGDFASDLVTYYTPSEAKWTDYMVTAPIHPDNVDQVTALVSAREDDLFDLITGSNYNDISPQVMFEAGHGTIAMWVESAHFSQPIFCETVPPHELLITPGHLGILDRFREKPVLASSLEALFSGWDVDLSDPALQRKITRPGATVKVCWGFWLDWSDPGNPMWKMEITADGKRITPETPETIGPFAGACPLMVGRFNPQPGKPWGRGPGWKSLPDMRVYNAVDEAVLDGLDQSLRNTLIYADDGFLDLSDGVDAGRSYPANRGFTRDQIYELQKGTKLDLGFFSEDRLEDRLRARWYQDGPRQRGETPPTASQWIDERRRVQQRIGKPSAPLWKEFFLPFIQRVEYIAIEKSLMQEAITLNEQAITVQPVSPLQKAQNQDKVMVSRSNLELGAGVFGEAFGQAIDVIGSFKNIVKASGDELTVVRDEPAQGNPDGTTPPTE
ncbi:hypothetical protein GCM10011360_17540 [Primorskyibacter flagellatus]|uniref:Bacteriophage head to tail connecting protein n=1 Tax=Primorskyibacter flagellatus TaxID=1387277 RepID=A0A917A681_9RHOB|nr:portal protein [Primorskyibacter flagellatus]GGE29962.1 hypothetical protein GCM10011360_17540 [Primorskyibacter flagellatus]